MSASRSAPRLFVDRPLAAGAEITLGDDAARHVGRVLRCRPGDALTLFDGSGAEFAGSLASVGRRGVVIRLAERRDVSVESSLGITLIQGVARGDRMDTVVQKATELGVRRIVPLLSEFSVVRLDAERAEKRRQHWQRVAASACEQCGRNVLPSIDPPVSLPELLAAAIPANAARLLLLPSAPTALPAAADGPGAVELLVGPEGGLSDDEIELATSRGYRPVSLGPRILRTETAAIAALTVAQALWGDLGAARR